MRIRGKLRTVCVAILFVIFAVGLFAGTVSPYSYSKQFRERPNAAPSSSHLLGTDSLGRDLLTRLIYGTRVSLLLAPAAALLATLICLWLFRCCLCCLRCARCFRWMCHLFFPSSPHLFCWACSVGRLRSALSGPPLEIFAIPIFLCLRAQWDADRGG